MVFGTQDASRFHRATLSLPEKPNTNIATKCLQS
jgi:hypothetical protein